MRATSTMSAAFALGLLLTGGAFSAAPESPVGTQSSRIATPATGLQFACTRKECVALCPDLRGAAYKRCYNDCRKRRENC